MNVNADPDGKLVSALVRGVSILRCFSNKCQELSAKELMDLTGLPKPTLFRLTDTLCELGLLRYSERLSKYVPGLGLLQLSSPVLTRMALRQFARPHMQALADLTEGQVQLGYLYELGAGVPKNDAAVADLMSRAANAGNAEAQFNLALYASQGRYGFAKDPEQSFAWAKRSADQGFAQAQRYVGACYEYGVGVSVNPSEAAAWYSKAAAQGLEKEGNIFNTERVYTMP